MGVTPHEQRHGRDGAAGPCFQCGHGSPEWLLELQWMNVRSRLTPGGVANIVRVINAAPAAANDEVVERTGSGFRTFHPACDACRRGVGRRRTCVKVLMTLMATLAVIGFGGSVVGGLALLSTTALPGSDERVGLVRAACGGIPVALLALACLHLMKPLTVPRGVRHLARRPFLDNAAIFLPIGSSVEVPLLIRHKYKTLTFTDAELRAIAVGGGGSLARTIPQA